MNVRASAAEHQWAAPVRATFGTTVQFVERHRHQLWRWIVIAFCFVSSCAYAQRSVTLAWDRNTETNIAGYRVHYGTASRAYMSSINVGNVTTASVTNLAAGVTYMFAVTAYNAAGAESDFSAEVSHTVTNSVATNLPPTLAAISNLTINEDSGPHSVLLSGITSGGENQTLSVTASATQQSLIPSVQVAYTSPNNTGTISFATAPNSSGNATITVTVSDGLAQTTRSFSVIVNPVNDPPTLTSIADRTILEDTATAPVAFTIGDPDTPGANLSLSGTSSDTALVPNANIVFGGTGLNRTVQVTPQPNRSGTASIQVSVSDGALSATRTFQVTVTASNDPPTIAALPAATVPPQAVTALQPVVITDVDTGASNLVVVGTSSDTNVLPHANIVVGAIGLSRTLSVQPLRSGVATVTLRVSDGGAQSSQSFLLTVTNVTGRVQMRASYDPAIRGFSISWNSQIGAMYRVLSKNSLTEPDWTNVTGNIRATAATTSWVDLTAGGPSSAFYIIEMVSPGRTDSP